MHECVEGGEKGLLEVVSNFNGYDCNRVRARAREGVKLLPTSICYYIIAIEIINDLKQSPETNSLQLKKKSVLWHALQITSR